MCYRDVADLKAFPAQVVFMKSCRAKPSTVKKNTLFCELAGISQNGALLAVELAPISCNLCTLLSPKWPYNDTLGTTGNYS